MWAEWANEPGCKHPGRAEGKLVSFLYSGKSQSQTVWVCRMYLNLLRDGRKRKGGKRERSGDKLFLVFCFLSYLLLFAYIKRRKSEITGFHVNVNSCSIFLPLHVHTASLSLSLSFSFFLDFIVVTMEKKDLQRLLKGSMNFSGRAVTSVWLSLDWAQMGLTGPPTYLHPCH